MKTACCGFCHGPMAHPGARFDNGAFGKAEILGMDVILGNGICNKKCKTSQTGLLFKHLFTPIISCFFCFTHVLSQYFVRLWFIILKNLDSCQGNFA